MSKCQQPGDGLNGSNWDQARSAHRADQAAALAGAALTLVVESGASALTMAAVAKRAAVSRQTLYRYYPDLDSLLLAMAQLVASHDGAFREAVAAVPDPMSRLHLIAETLWNAHGDLDPDALAGLLTPDGREILAQHQRHHELLVAEVLHAGMDSGDFRSDLEPDQDAALVLGLIQAATHPDHQARANFLLSRLVTTPNTNEEPDQ